MHCIGSAQEPHNNSNSNYHHSFNIITRRALTLVFTLKGHETIHTLSLTPLLPSPSLSVNSSSLVPFIIIIVILTIVLTIIIIFILIIGGAIKSSKASQNLGRASYFKGTEGVHFYIWVEFKIKASWLSGMHIALELMEQIAFIRFDYIASQNVCHQMIQLKKCIVRFLPSVNYQMSAQMSSLAE